MLLWNVRWVWNGSVQAKDEVPRDARDKVQVHGLAAEAKERVEIMSLPSRIGLCKRVSGIIVIACSDGLQGAFLLM